MPARKHSDLEVRQRIDAVIAKIVSGVVVTRDLLRFIEENYNVSASQAEKDIRKAKKEIGSLMTDWEKEEQKRLSLTRYNLLFQRNFNLQDYREARQVQTRIDAVFGIDAAKQIDLKTKNEIDYSSLTDKELITLAKLQRKIGAG